MIKMTKLSATSSDLPRVLIADDDPAIVRLLADRCKRMGFRTETASNGIQLLVRARHFQPDIMVVDVNMPSIDGVTVCARLRDTKGKTSKVIIVTGYPSPGIGAQCDSLGFMYVRKGCGFWTGIESALKAIYPDMAAKIEEALLQVVNTKVPEHPRVLVVDDDPAMEAFFTGRLNKYGVDLLFASDAVGAYRLACRSTPSAIIADNFMPNGDARYLLHRLRSAPPTDYIPVIIMSGSRLDELTARDLTREISGRPGAARVVEKTFAADEIFVLLQQYCGLELH
jgi:CheY-like chemotaxis protein